MGYKIAADAVVVLHAAYVAGVVLGQLAILIGMLRHWEWIRHPGFRWGHLTAITIVVIESVLGIPCPLTVWESELRLKAGEVAYRGDFVGYWTHRWLFYDFPPGVFTSVYVAFGLLVVASFWGAPPRRKSP